MVGALCELYGDENPFLTRRARACPSPYVEGERFLP